MSAYPDAITIDFETEAIEDRPKYPPAPVGFSLRLPGRNRAQYFGWGHPSGNNCTRKQAMKILKTAWLDRRTKLFHNSKFDMDVAETHCGMPRLKPDQFHDTMFLAFLVDPDRRNLKLKELAASDLGIDATERDALREWILENIPEARKKKSEWAAHISKAPGGLVGKYAADGDAEMTWRLFKKYYPEVVRRKMSVPYLRERRCMAPLLEAERRGVRVDLKRLERELPFYETLLEEIDARIRRKLKAPGLDLDKRGSQLADALDAAGMVEQWQVSDKGNRLTNKKALMVGMSDKVMLAMLFYRNALATSIRTFMRPWYATAKESGGLIFTKWNQVRQSGDTGNPFGAKTGRMSSSPNFQNIPIYTRSVLILPNLITARVPLVSASALKKFSWAAKMEFTIEMPDKTKITVGHACPLPMMKEYVLPLYKDHVVIERDYSQQELRIMAHFEDGPFLETYRKNPRQDAHDLAAALIYDLVGVRLDRRPVKDVAFSLLYGMGLAELARKLDKPIDEAKKIKAAYLGAMPGFKALTDDLKRRSEAGLPLRTWGGREYYAEKPRIIKGRLREFGYKQINRLIQGSAADCTKEAIARYHEMGEKNRHGGLFLMTVHDSTAISAPKASWEAADRALRLAHESVEFDVPMLTDGKRGPTLGHMEKTKDADNDPVFARMLRRAA